jgi:hypothetical protein
VAIGGIWILLANVEGSGRNGKSLLLRRKRYAYSTELCLFRGRATAVGPSVRYPAYTSQFERAEFVTKVQPTTKVFDHCMNKKFTDCYAKVGNG